MRRAALPLLAVLVALPFGLYALGLAIDAARGLRPPDSHLFAPGAPASNAALALHMAAGAVLTALVPLQLIPALRRRWPGLHRGMGRIFVGAALAAGLGGLVYIAGRGTIGGPVMDAGFALYGVLLGVAALMAIRAARARDLVRHRRWALRFFTLAMGSLLFRLHYAAWFLATGGAGSTEALTGPFDRVQVFAFYLPYLALLELWLSREKRGAAPKSDASAG